MKHTLELSNPEWNFLMRLVSQNLKKLSAAEEQAAVRVIVKLKAAARPALKRGLNPNALLGVSR